MSSELDVSSETQLGTSASAVATSSESLNEQSSNRNHDGPLSSPVAEDDLVDYNENDDPEQNPSLASAKSDDELEDYNDSDQNGKDAVEAAPADSSDQMSNGENDQVPVPIITGPCFPLMNEDGTMRDPKDLTWQDLLQVLHASQDETCADPHRWFDAFDTPPVGRLCPKPCKTCSAWILTVPKS